MLIILPVYLVVHAGSTRLHSLVSEPRPTPDLHSQLLPLPCSQPMNSSNLTPPKLLLFCLLSLLCYPSHHVSHGPIVRLEFQSRHRDQDLVPAVSARDLRGPEKCFEAIGCHSDASNHPIQTPSQRQITCMPSPSLSEKIT